MLAKELEAKHCKNITHLHSDRLALKWNINIYLHLFSFEFSWWAVPFWGIILLSFPLCFTMWKNTAELLPASFAPTPRKKKLHWWCCTHIEAQNGWGWKNCWRSPIVEFFQRSSHHQIVKKFISWLYCLRNWENNGKFVTLFRACWMIQLPPLQFRLYPV